MDASREAEMSGEIAALLQGLSRDKFGQLKGERLRQLARIGLYMKMDENTFALVRAEIQEIRKAQLARLENWRRISGGH